MEMKTKILDKKHIIIISISILAFIISFFNVSYAYFSDSKNEPISIRSVASFGESTVHNTDVVLEGNLIYTTNKQEMLTNYNNQSLSITMDNVDKSDYLITLATQVDPHNTDYELNEYTNISYEVYHKTDETLNTTSFNCDNYKYNNGTNEDYCNAGTFIENSLEGLPFELIKDFRITDTNTHYFDVYIYLNNDVTSKKLKTRMFYLEKSEEKKENKSTPNPPDIENTGLVPIKYNETTGKWKVTTEDDPDWYDYDKQKWANAVSIKSGVITEDNPYPELTVPDGTSTESDILAMFVWIPRYSYTIGCTSTYSCLGYKIDGASELAIETPGAIDIKFVDKDTNETYTGDSPTYIYTSESDREPINYYTHPAFWWDVNDDGIWDDGENLSGIWVGKFETSVNPNSDCYTNINNYEQNLAANNCVSSKEDVTPRILPNVLSLIYQNIYNKFETAKKFAINTAYNLKSSADSHMMKNSEWGAVAYLSQSIYGKYGNLNYLKENKEVYLNDSGFEYDYYFGGRYTGRSQGASTNESYSETGTCKYNELGENRTEGSGSCGPGASTTGNVYGIYDMSGGSLENVMGYYVDENLEFGSIKGGNISGFTNNTKPELKYFDMYLHYIGFGSEDVYGHAFHETEEWYSDDISTISVSNRWVIRGGEFWDSSWAGIFSAWGNDGGVGSISSFRSVLTTVTS